jgi:hypothetical protein
MPSKIYASLDSSGPLCCTHCNYSTSFTANQMYALAVHKGGTFSLTCSNCNRVIKYDEHEALKLIPKNSTPSKLWDDQRMVLVLIEVGKSKSGTETYFLGEKIRVRQFRPDGERWTARTMDTTLFAPSLVFEDAIAGTVLGQALVTSHCWNGTRWIKLNLTLPPPGRSRASSFIQQRGIAERIKPMTPKCSNPSCPHLFSMTYAEYRKQTSNVLDRGQDHVYLLADCTLCGCSTAISETSFAGVYQG